MTGKCGGVSESWGGCATLQRDLGEGLENGTERNFLKFKSRKCKVLHVGRTSAGPREMLGADRLERSFAEQDLVVLVENKLTTRRQCILVAKAAKSLQGSVGKGISNTSGEVILLSLQGW